MSLGINAVKPHEGGMPTPIIVVKLTMAWSWESEGIEDKTVNPLPFGPLIPFCITHVKVDQ